MELDCAGCAGCCIDWRPLAPGAPDHERLGGRLPVDDSYNVVPLTRDEVRDFCAAGLGDALVPRLWSAAEGDDHVDVDGVRLAAVAGRPVFVVGLRKPPKPVAPFGTERAWLDACVFLDPETLRCRVHGDDRYPGRCADYPGQNLLLDAETECERVESAFGGERLLDDDPPAEGSPPPLGPQALGATVFAHPRPDELDGVVARLRDGDASDADRAEFVGVAVGHRPGSLDVDEALAAEWRERARSADSWVGPSAAAWEAAAEGDVDDAPTGEDVEVARGAPATSPWPDVDE